MLPASGALYSCTTYSCLYLVLQRGKLEEAQQGLASLDKKFRDHKAKEKKAQDEVTRAEADLANLPPPPEGTVEKKAALLQQARELEMEVSWTRHVLPAACLTSCFWVMP